MEGSLGALVGLLLMLPFQLWRERSQKFQRLSPVEQNLQRASHGAALIVLVLLAVIFAFRVRDIPGFFIRAATDPADAWPGLLLLVPLAYGLARFLAGVRRSWGVRDGLLATRSFVKLAIGGLGWWLLWTDAVLRVTAPNFWLALCSLLLTVLAIWWFVSGTVSFLLLTFGGRRQPKMPPAVSDPHGAARDATPAEARAAMRGHGGQRSALDDERF